MARPPPLSLQAFAGLHDSALSGEVVVGGGPGHDDHDGLVEEQGERWIELAGRVDPATYSAAPDTAPVSAVSIGAIRWSTSPTRT